MKIAIVGRAASAGQAPVDDPDWTVWGLAWSPPRRWDRLFDVHSRRLRKTYGGPAYEDRLGAIAPLTMLFDPLPHAEPYPVDDVRALVGDGVLSSSIAYMLALAVLLAPQEIGLWGVDMTTTPEYRRQRPAIHFLLGLARGRGIAVTLPPDCPLFPTAPDYGA